MRKRLAVAIAAALFLSYQWFPSGAWEPKRARLEAVAEWRISESWFGGFSGIEVAEDGQSFVAISDRSWLVRGNFKRTDGEITGIILDERHALHTTPGERLRNEFGDSEGLAVDGRNRTFVSFEAEDRVMQINDSGHGRELPVSKAFDAMPRNGAFEALAVAPDGDLFAIPESPLGRANQALVFQFDGRKWTQPFPISRHKKFRPVGADFGPDGRFYLLERAFNGFGFRSRVRRFDVTPNGFANETELIRTFFGMHDNLEGLSVWRDPEGHIRLTMISDDNYRFVQRTEIVEYIVFKTP
ncbi:esterase-like activity of phytase family protein [Shimia sediminis]|uniref:esterase-like activity of phytase family protein n=1 Tax=Shimia sediminis TaxID=2497945 RepID=UPI000F8EB53F|nr:esterase-like activity of phytase family protein [Shimia sediminis]